jgi:uncharacterized membrane protein
MPVVLEADKMGPVDVAVIAFDGSEFNDEVGPALAELQARGTVKVIDMAFVRKAADGSTSIVEIADDTVGEVFERLTDFQVDLLSEADLADLADALTPETSAMVVVWENSWAARFAADVRASHGRVAMLERIPHENVERAISALDEEPSITAVEE